MKSNKWNFHWATFSILVGVIIFAFVKFEDKSWLPNFLQAIGTITGIYLTIIIFLQSKEESDKQFRNQLEHLQQLNANQIKALQHSTDEQIKALQELTDKQISALQELTERQIEALHQTTFEQISAFEQQIKYVTIRLSDNSILLAEILGRELEKSIEIYDSAIQREEAKYKDLTGWKFLRTQEERENQLNSQWNKIQRIKDGYDYLVDKYNKVREFLGFGQKKLNG